MNASTAIADSLLGTHCPMMAIGAGLRAESKAKYLSAAMDSNAAAQAKPGMAGGLAAWSVDILFQVCVPCSWLSTPVSQCDSRVPVVLPDATGGTRRTVMNNVGLAGQPRECL